MDKAVSQESKNLSKILSKMLEEEAQFLLNRDGAVYRDVEKNQADGEQLKKCAQKLKVITQCIVKIEESDQSICDHLGIESDANIFVERIKEFLEEIRE